MSSPERRRIVEAVREHARNAARTGSTHCPYTHADKAQWDDAYRRELDQISIEEQVDLRSRIESAETIEDIKSILLEMLP